jgi:hypothetical protein
MGAYGRQWCASRPARAARRRGMAPCSSAAVTFAGAAGEAMVKKYVLNGFKNAVCGHSSGSVDAAAPLRATAPGGCCAVHFVPSVGRSAAAAADPRLRSRPVPKPIPTSTTVARHTTPSASAALQLISWPQPAAAQVATDSTERSGEVSRHRRVLHSYSYGRRPRSAPKQSRRRSRRLLLRWN